MIAVLTFVAAMVIFLAGLAAVASGCRNEYQRRQQFLSDPVEASLMTEIEEWLKQQQ